MSQDHRHAAFGLALAACLVAAEMHVPQALPWWGQRALFLAALPFAAALWLVRPRVPMRLGLGDLRRGAIALAIGTPLGLVAMLVLAFDAESRDFHPTADLAVYAGAIVPIEVCFRGVLLSVLETRLGPLAAAAATTVPYALVHLDKPAAEAFGSIPVGLFLAIVAQRTGSIWSGTLLHLFGALSFTFVSRLH